MASLKYLCFIGSVREGRLADRMKILLQNQFAKTMEQHSLTIIDPEDYDLPLLKKPLHFYSPAEQQNIPPKLQQLSQHVTDADVILVLTPEYNRSVPPALLNTLDHIAPNSYAYKSSGVVAYSMGINGGAFASAAIRPVLTELGCLPVKHALHIPKAHTVVDESGACKDDHVTSSMTKLFKETEWWGTQAKAGREKGTPK